jgi:hypothetical protein
MSPHLFGCFLLSAVGAVVAVSAPLAQCPESTVSCIAENPAVVVFSALETSDAPSARVAFQGSWASYDLVAGTISTMAFVDVASHNTSRALATDRFELRGGVAAAVTIRLRLYSDAVTDPSGRVAWIIGSARLTARDQTVTAETTTVGISPFIEISTYLIDGEPIEITYEAMAEGWGYGPSCLVSGQIEFIGLPEGAQIISCNGFNATPVPTRSVTWGAVKALYR